jgi:hypothetical protein
MWVEAEPRIILVVDVARVFGESADCWRVKMMRQSFPVLNQQPPSAAN